MSTVTTRGEPNETLVGAGRTADVFARGEHEVLRRYRSPRDTEREVAAMEHARAQGYPVPPARAVSDTDIVMERLSGPTMLIDLGRRPWLVARHAATLADLHRRLHAITAPGWLPSPLGDGDALLHLDLHPENVIMTPRGPMVIDWLNAAKGPGDADVAFSWTVIACSLPPQSLYRRVVTLAGRRLFLDLFLRHFDRERVRAHLAEACTYRLGSRKLPARELDAIARLRAGAPPAGEKNR